MRSCSHFGKPIFILVLVIGIYDIVISMILKNIYFYIF
jgi:hypothetical protein